MIFLLGKYIVKINLFPVIILFLVSLVDPTISFSQEELNPPKCSFNCGNSDTKSPWNFVENFETNSWKKNFQPTPSQIGWSPFFIKEEKENKFLVVKVHHNLGGDVGLPIKKTGKKAQKTERAELGMHRKKIFGKEIWYSFDVKIAEQFPKIMDRQLFTQVKTMNNQGKTTPLFALHYRGFGMLDVFKAPCNVNSGHDFRVSGAGIEVEKTFAPMMKCNGKTIYAQKDKLLGPNGQKFIFSPGSSERWTNWKIGIYVTNRSSGFISVYQDHKLMYKFLGPTFGFKSVDPESWVKIGLYRDSDPKGIGYPPQEIYFDNFKIGSSKKSVE